MGSYCPAGTEYADQYPCPAGTFTDSTSLTNSSQCTVCPQGYYCTIGGNSTDKVLCPRGKYCPEGSGYSHNYSCSAGTYSWSLGNYQQSQCGSCPGGFYCSRGASYVSGWCSQGHYCPSGSALPDAYACAAGTYNTYYNSSSSADCISCIQGYYCLAGASKPLPCPPGTYSSSTSTTSYSNCSNCPAGSYCPAGSVSSTVCKNGYYSLANAAECYACPGGYYCAGGIQTSCPAGSYCPLGSSTFITCPLGYYCQAGSSEGTPCPAGKYGSSTGLNAVGQCTTATAGYYTVIGSSSDTGLCEPGYYCPAGSSGPYENPCPAGTNLTAPGGTSSSSCLACPAGFYCKLGTAFPVKCPLGYYCPASTSTPIFCPSGTAGLTTGLNSSSSCTSCPSGTYCSQPGLLVADGNCVLGYICAAGSTVSTGSSTCPSGGYCQPGFPTQRACPPGTFNPDTGAKDITSCGSCDAGYYCYGNETVAFQRSCSAGYNCPVGSYWSQMNISTPGYYSLAASSVQTSCPIGTFNYLYAQSSCTNCTAGFYCPSKGMTYPTICPAGSYCVANSTTYTACPAGTFSAVNGLTQMSNCTYCTGGYYCLFSGITTTSGLCDPGYYCTFGSNAKKPVNSNTTSQVSGQCPTGFYCIQGTPIPTACPTGTFLSSILGSAATDCLPCTAGYYCTNTGLSSVQGPCDPGYYCLSGSHVGTTVPRPTVVGSELNYCNLGQYCPSGSSEPTSCSAGTYQDQLRQSSCNTCPAGYYCVSGTGNYTQFLCPVGYYCPAGTAFMNQYPCPQGTFSPVQGLTESSQCLQCTPGNYCGTTGLNATSGLCQAGYFCKIGSKLSNPQVDFPGDANGGRCIPGYYCPQGIAYALECDGGKYCSGYFLSNYTNNCTAGYYCIGKASSATPTDGVTGNICPKGYYCPSGSIYPIACPKGTYNGATQKSSLSDCLSCPPGKYCGSAGLSTYTNVCQAGFYCVGGNYELMPKAGKCTIGNYCPAGSFSLNACPPGTYQDQNMQSACKTCPAGYFCLNDATTSPTLCPPGYYCPAGSSVALACPAGTYTSKSGRTIVDQCTNCPSGYYCLGGKNATDGKCAAGNYCLQGATAAAPTVDAQGGSCQKGYYCPVGSTSQIPCTPGYYCSTTLLSAPTGKCSAGYYCIQGASISNPRDKVTGAICPAGYYCPQGSAYPIPCSIGTYQDFQGKTQSSDCKICLAGYYCSNQAAVSLSGLCTAGYFCPSGTTTGTPVSNICPIGYYCPLGSSSQIICPDGYYQNQIGQSSCKVCPRGFYCNSGASTLTICTVGYICPLGTSFSTRVPCGYGSYNPFEGQSTCLSCPIGKYCPAGPLTTPLDCPINSYCESGTSTPIPTCPDGTYTDLTQIQSKAQCKQCPTGYYCLFGNIAGPCSAGYYCISGMNTAVPTSNPIIGTGGPCPVGHYCPLGTLIPTACPSGTSRVSTGGQSESDCTLCSAGYYCIPNNPIPVVCPTGAYCPQGSSLPVLCPAGYYSSSTQASDISTCVKCPSGYLCDRSGIGDYTNFPCIPGSYCPSGTLVAIPSVAGFYSPGSYAGTTSDLVSCPGGYYCQSNSTGYIMCTLGTYCPLRSSSQSNCPNGYFCDYHCADPQTCPVGWYCSGYPNNNYTETPPILCGEGTLCNITTSKTGSSVNYKGAITPWGCPAGYYAKMARSFKSPNYSCYSCPAGTYSNISSTNCTYCNAGYICLGNSTKATPTNRTTDKGYACGPGYYCPMGATSPVPCPPGTYSDQKILTSISQCIACPSGTYNRFSGVTTCNKCSSSSSSAVGSTFCSCKGKYRLYLELTNSCVCINGYQFISSSGSDLSKVDGSDDCSQKVYPRCADGQVRNVTNGDCINNDDCSGPCGPKGGIIPYSNGVSTCRDVQDLNAVCNSNCQSKAIKISFGPDGSIIETDPVRGNSTSYNSSTIPGLLSKMNCDTSYPSCKIYNVKCGLNNRFGGDYTGTINVGTASKNRRLTTSSYVYNPVICLTTGESMIFSVSQSNYPVYLVNSLVNTNKYFDYSAFTQLAQNLSASSTTTQFGFTFTSAGIYIFADSSDYNQQLVIAVMDLNKQCPFSGSNIQPRTATSLYLIGTSSDTNIVLSVDWNIIYGIMGFLVLSVIIFIAIFYYYTGIT